MSESLRGLRGMLAAATLIAALVHAQPAQADDLPNTPFVASRAMGRQDADCILRQLPWRRHVIDDASRGADGVRLADVNADGHMDITTGWEEGGLTRVYLNPGPDKAKTPWPAVTVGSTPDVEDAVFADLDGDGAVDVISSCEGKTRTVFIHWAPRKKDRYLDPQAWTTQAVADSIGRTMWMFCVPVQLDGANGLDLILGSKGPDAMIGFYQIGPDARSDAAYKWHKLSDAGWIMSLVAVDMDNDGDLDILTSDRRGDLRGVRWLENPGAEYVAKRPWNNHFIGGRDWEVMFLRVADLDNDGLDDIVVAAKQGSRTQRILWYRRKDRTGLHWEERMIPFPPNTGGAKGVAVGDMDGDGRSDIVLSCEGADGGKSGVMWLRQEPDGTWTPGEISGPAGVKFDRIELLDLDGDGDLDVLTCEEQGINSRGQKDGLGVFWYENPLK
ncbi:MAG: VCBS repeat-containing protein [Phycisphaerae bacterium]|nr:VCBS repeat-containing protein [Phycisphaerae bacterium]